MQFIEDHIFEIAIILILLVLGIIFIKIVVPKFIKWFDYEGKKEQAFSFPGFEFKSSFWLSLFKIFHIILTASQKKEITFRAAGLTFYTFTSIVPVLAAIHFVFGSFGNGKDPISIALDDFFKGNPVVTELCETANSKSTDSKMLPQKDSLTVVANYRSVSIPDGSEISVKKDSIQTTINDSSKLVITNSITIVKKDTCDIKPANSESDSSEKKSDWERIKNLFAGIFFLLASVWGMLRMVMTIDSCANKLWDSSNDHTIPNQILKTILYYVGIIAIILISAYTPELFKWLAVAIALFLIIYFSPQEKVNWELALLGTVVSLLFLGFLNSEFVREIISNAYSDYGKLFSLILLLITINWSWFFILVGFIISNLKEQDEKEFMYKETKAIAPAYETYLTIYIAAQFYKRQNEDFDKIKKEIYDLHISNVLLNRIFKRLDRLGYLNMKDKKIGGKENPTAGELMYDMNFGGKLCIKYKLSDNEYFWEDYKKALINGFKELGNAENRQLKDLNFQNLNDLKVMDQKEADEEDKKLKEEINVLFKETNNNTNTPKKASGLFSWIFSLFGKN